MTIEPTSRPCVVIGNWKMHKTIEEALAFVKELPSLLLSDQSSVQVGLAVPFTMIYPLAQEVKEGNLLIGAQNMNDASAGAFTGEIAGSMLKDAGAKFVLLGHSERRKLYHEGDEWINHKVKRAIEVGLQPVLCVGETKQEYEEQQTHAVIERQLTEGLKGLDPQHLQHLMIAYEPVWAIGHGNSATPEIVQEVQHFCRQVLSKILTEEQAQQVVILYGGSVNPTNAKELLAQPAIDGLLIGGASLVLESFAQIVNDYPAKINNPVEG